MYTYNVKIVYKGVWKHLEARFQLTMRMLHAVTHTA